MANGDKLPVILLVSDSALTSKSVNRLLAEQFQVLQEDNIESAWESIQVQTDISAILCDLNPTMDYEALLERIRTAQNKVISGLPVLLLVSEKVDEQHRDRAFMAGATDFINTPFSATELKARVRLHARLFNLHRGQGDYDLTDQHTAFDMLNAMMHERHFMGRLEQELSFALRHKVFISACLLQVDAADELREQYGKKVFSGIIRSVATIIQKRIRREDTYAYLGNATFALLFPVTNGLGANVATRRIVEKVDATHIKLQGEKLPVTLSGGLVSELPTEEQRADEIMEVLHSRLLKAVNKGGNQIVSSKTEQEQSQITLEQALNMISFERTEGLEKQIPHLLDTLMPLLEFAKQHNEVEFEGVIGSLE
jgi:diguanylate cyclase (GGDEF)-like protein